MFTRPSSVVEDYSLYGFAIINTFTPRHALHSQPDTTRYTLASWRSTALADELECSCSILFAVATATAPHAHLVPARKRQSRRSWTTKISARCVHVFTTSMSCCARVGTAPVVRSRPLARVGTACGATFKCSPRVCRAPLHTSEGTSVTSSPLATARTWTPSAPYQDRRTGHADGNEGSAAKWQMGWGKAHET